MKYKMFVDDNGELKEVLDTGEFDALRQLIAQEVAKYLPLSGGVMTGNLLFNDVANIYRNDDSSVLTFHGGPTWDKCPKLRFFGSNYSDASLRGIAQLDAYSNGQSSYLSLAPNGHATVNGSTILTAAGGEMNGGAYIAGQSGLLRGNSDAGDIWISGQPVSTNGSFIQLNGGSRADQPGYIIISPGTPTSRAMIEFLPDGSIWTNGSIVHTAASGLLMNWGNVSAGTVSGGSFTLPSGGTWAYILVRGQYDGNAAKAGTAAGGTTVATNDDGTHAFFAIRIV